MKFPVFSSLLLLSLMLCLSGCHQQTATLKGVVFERGHGSMWGNQFFIEVCETEITQVQYFPSADPGGELEMTEHLPLQPEQWDAIQKAVLALSPQLQKSNSRKTIKQGMLDGGEFYKLTLIWEQNEKLKEVQYNWPGSDEAKILENLLLELTPVENND